MTLYISLSEQDIDELRNGNEVKVIPPQNCTYDFPIREHYQCQGHQENKDGKNEVEQLHEPCIIAGKPPFADNP